MMDPSSAAAVCRRQMGGISPSRNGLWQVFATRHTRRFHSHFRDRTAWDCVRTDNFLIWIIMTAPNIDSSTREERLDYVLNEWRCLHNCEICGKCHVLKGRSEEILYADYIDGKRSYMEITLESRSNR